MIVDFNIKDDGIPAIQEKAALTGLYTTKDYRIYGNGFFKGRPLIRIDALEKMISEKQENELTAFFKRNGLDIQFFDEANKKFPDRIYVGFRKDLRSNTKLCAGILQTIIYYLENKTELDKEFKIKDVPNFANPTEEAPVVEKKPKKKV